MYLCWSQLFNAISISLHYNFIYISSIFPHILYQANEFGGLSVCHCLSVFTHSTHTPEWRFIFALWFWCPFFELLPIMVCFGVEEAPKHFLMVNGMNINHCQMIHVILVCALLCHLNHKFAKFSINFDCCCEHIWLAEFFIQHFVTHLATALEFSMKAPPMFRSTECSRLLGFAEGALTISVSFSFAFECAANGATVCEEISTFHI